MHVFAHGFRVIVFIGNSQRPGEMWPRINHSLKCSVFVAFLRKLSKKLCLLACLSSRRGDRDPFAKAGLGKETLLQPLCGSAGSLCYPGLSLWHLVPCSQPASWARKLSPGSRNDVIAALRPAQPQPITSNSLPGFQHHLGSPLPALHLPLPRTL